METKEIELDLLAHPNKRSEFQREVDINALGQAIDTTWGRSSTPMGASQSVKFTLGPGNSLTASYTVIVNFISEKEMILMKRKCREESDDIIAAHVAHVKKTYKELSKQNLKLKEIFKTDSLEIIGFNVHNPKRTAYYRKKVLMEIL